VLNFKEILQGTSSYGVIIRSGDTLRPTCKTVIRGPGNGRYICPEEILSGSECGVWWKPCNIGVSKVDYRRVWLILKILSDCGECDLRLDPVLGEDTAPVSSVVGSI
jgi:hypothetical protein